MAVLGIMVAEPYGRDWEQIYEAPRSCKIEDNKSINYFNIYNHLNYTAS